MDRKPRFKAKNMAEVKRNNEAIGNTFFAEKVMKAFGSKVESELFKNNTFITSEPDGFGRDRRFTVRRYDPETAEISDVSHYRQFTKKATAVSYAVGYTGPAELYI